jgi:hypothetical protein
MAYLFTGRIGSAAPADAIIGALVGLFAVLLCSTSTTLAVVMSHSGRVWLYRAAALIFAATIVAGAVDPDPFTVSPPRGKRLYLQHAVRTIHGTFSRLSDVVAVE